MNAHTPVPREPRSPGLGVCSGDLEVGGQRGRDGPWLLRERALFSSWVLHCSPFQFYSSENVRNFPVPSPMGLQTQQGEKIVGEIWGTKTGEGPERGSEWKSSPAGRSEQTADN